MFESTHACKMFSIKVKATRIDDEHFNEALIPHNGTCLDISRYACYVPEPYIKFAPTYEVTDKIYR